MKDKIIENERIEEIVLGVVLEARDKFAMFFDFPEIDYSLTGATAGQANVTRGKMWLNMPLLNDNPSHMNDTIIHELCHLFAYKRWLALGSTCKYTGHGPLWQDTMLQLGQNPERCHSLDTSNHKRKMMYFRYSCCCSEHWVSKTTHNKIQRGQNRVCLQCKGIIEPTGRTERR